MVERESYGRSLFRNLRTLILASASPRRSELLKSIGLRFEMIPSGVEETTIPGDSPDSAVKRWASEKALAVSRLQPQSWVLGADTVVVLEGTIFGKPESPQEAAYTLRRLSGKTHRVVTGICLMHHDLHFARFRAVETQVEFRSLTQDEIEAYVGTGEPLDKAGAYGVQGMGACLVRSIEGSYTNVVGLPLCEIVEWLLEQGVVAPVVTR